MRTLRLITLLAAIGVSMHVPAQDCVAQFVKKLGTTIDSMAVRGIDQRYIEVPKRPWQIISRWNMNQSIISMRTSGNIEGVSYSQLMGGLHKAGIEINRKILADLAVNHPEAFKAIVAKVK